MELAFRESGQGRPLVILHGLFGQSDNWNTLAKQFAKEGYRVFTVDQRNHGLSPHSDVHTFEAMADDLAGFIQKHKLGDPVLIGHSMGGKTLLFFEKKYPGIAQKLVVVDIASRRYEPHHQDVLDALNSVDLNQVKSRKEAENMLSQKISDAGTRQFLVKNLYWKDDRLHWRFNLPVITRDYINVTAEVPFFTSNTPLLVIRGENSRYVSEEDVTDFRKRFARCGIATIKGSGHWVHAENPQAFFETALSFIRS